MSVTGPRIGLSDRIHLGESATALIGPVDLPDLETVRSNLDAFASFGPATRIALRPDPNGRRWIHDPRRLLDTVEVVDEPADPLDLLVPDGRPNAPMRITLAGRYLRTDHEHGVGEIRFGLLAHQIITGAVSPQDPEMLAQISRRWDGLATAGLRVFGSRPTRVFDVLRSMRETKPTQTEPTGTKPTETKPTPAGPEFPIDTAAPTTTPPPNLGPHTVAVAAMPANALGDLRAWRDAALPGISLFTLVVSGLTRALVRAGIAVDDVGTLPVDLRRYLPRGTNPLANFVSGIQLPLRDGNDPARLHDDLTTAVTSGRPIVSLARVTALSRAAQLLAPDGRHATTPPPKAPLVFTGIQAHQQVMDSFPWIDRDNSVYVTGTRPAVPNGITLQSATIHDRLLISASFQPEVHPRGRVRAALDGFATDPVTVLRTRT
ncbi:MAG: hypothetical protein WAV90_02125 [Gordonia amarae]